MTTFTRDIQKVGVKASVDSSTFDFEVSTDGTVKINTAFTVSGAQTVGGALTAGSLVVQGGARVSAISSLEGAVVAKSTLNVTGAVDAAAGARVSAIASLEGAVVAKSTLNVSGVLTATATVEAGAVLKPGVSTTVSSFNPLAAVRYLTFLDNTGAKVFVPFVSVLPS